MRRARLALLTVAGVLVLAVAGCGGTDLEYEEVRSAPPALPIPEDSGSVTAADDGADATETPTPTPTPDAGAGTGGATPGTTTAPPADPGTTTAPAPDTGGATGGTTPEQPQEPADTGGATADEGLDQFCADNPGACDG